MEGVMKRSTTADKSALDSWTVMDSTNEASHVRTPRFSPTASESSQQSMVSLKGQQQSELQKQELESQGNPDLAHNITGEKKKTPPVLSGDEKPIQITPTRTPDYVNQNQNQAGCVTKSPPSETELCGNSVKCNVHEKRKERKEETTDKYVNGKDSSPPTMKYLTQYEAYSPAPSGQTKCEAKFLAELSTANSTSQGPHTRDGQVEELTSEVLGPLSSSSTQASTSSTSFSAGVPSLVNQGQKQQHNKYSNSPSHSPCLKQRKNNTHKTLGDGVLESHGPPATNSCCQHKYNALYIVNPVKFMNSRASPGQAYVPTKFEHIANMVTHGLIIGPAILGMFWMLSLTTNSAQYWAALVYGLSTLALFITSTTFHTLCYHTGKYRNLKEFFHIGDRAVIYIFIAASYTPWLILKDFYGWATLTLWVVWIGAGAGIIYQYTFHEQYKWLETLFYLIVGVCPSIIIMSMKEHTGLYEMFLGGGVYIIGVIFFKCDGVIPFAHAIWHCFVFVGAVFHYIAVCKHLLGETKYHNVIVDEMSSL